MELFLCFFDFYLWSVVCVCLNLLCWTVCFAPSVNLCLLFCFMLGQMSAFDMLEFFYLTLFCPCFLMNLHWSCNTFFITVGVLLLRVLLILVFFVCTCDWVFFVSMFLLWFALWGMCIASAVELFSRSWIFFCKYYILSLW